VISRPGEGEARLQVKYGRVRAAYFSSGEFADVPHVLRPVMRDRRLCRVSECVQDGPQDAGSQAGNASRHLAPRANNGATGHGDYAVPAQAISRTSPETKTVRAAQGADTASRGWWGFKPGNPSSHCIASRWGCVVSRAVWAQASAIAEDIPHVVRPVMRDRSRRATRIERQIQNAGSRRPSASRKTKERKRDRKPLGSTGRGR
jgi:hypothetical protein